MKKIGKVVLLLAVVFGSAALVKAAGTQVAVGAPAKSGGVVGGRLMPKDGDGVAFSGGDITLGYKVFEDSGTASTILLADENGANPTTGFLHAVCLDSAATAAQVSVQDSSATTTSFAGLAGGHSLTGIFIGSTSLESCETVDAQFNNGLIVTLSAANDSVHLYWRPAAGQGN